MLSLMRAVVAAFSIATSALSAPAAAVLGSAAQETGVLRVTIVLNDAGGNPIPIPRVLLLISDNPSTSEPRRVRTGADGTVELKLRPGNYTVETDRPVSIGGQALGWTQFIDVTAGREAVLALTSQNADIEAAGADADASGATSADAAIIFSKWQRSVVEIWTPTAHATGFLIDSRGLIATNDRALGDAAAVEVQLHDALSRTQDPRPITQDPLKVAGRVVATDRLQGVTVIWVDPAAVASLTPISPGCGNAPSVAVEFDQKVAALIAPVLEPKDAIPGTVTRVGSQSFEVDWRLTTDAAGGPVFAADGTAIGITVAFEQQPDRPPRGTERRDDSYVIPIANTCAVLADAEKKLAGAAPPAGTPLRIDATSRPGPRKITDPKAPRLQAPSLSGDGFDVSLFTPAMANPRADFANWAEYVAKARDVLLVRATPQFEESFWKTLARGAAQTQGVALPPMKSFTANFLRMRAYCGAAEVAPIHPLVIERQVAERATIREGLYVYALTDFGPHCGTVRFELFSEKSGPKADSLTVDPALFARIAEQS
jgi:S1-C subfamily serine protease